MVPFMSFPLRTRLEAMEEEDIFQQCYAMLQQQAVSGEELLARAVEEELAYAASVEQQHRKHKEEIDSLARQRRETMFTTTIPRVNEIYKKWVPEGKGGGIAAAQALLDNLHPLPPDDESALDFLYELMTTQSFLESVVKDLGNVDDRWGDRLSPFRARCKFVAQIVSKARDIYVAIMNLGSEAGRSPSIFTEKYKTVRNLTKPPTPIIPENAETLLQCAQQAMVDFGKVQGAKGERAWTVKMDAMYNIEAALRPLSTEPTTFHLFDFGAKNLSHSIIWWKTSDKGWTTMRWTLLLATSSGYEQNLGVIDKTNQNMKYFLRLITDKAKST